jgi:hypothetical protein
MKSKKVVYLFLALLLPVGIFLFLKFFGRNEFAVKALYQDSVPHREACAGIEYKVPYVVPDSVLTQIKWNQLDSVTLVYFSNPDRQSKQEQAIQLSRVRSGFAPDKLTIMEISTDSLQEEAAVLSPLYFSTNEINVLQRCVFLLDAPGDAVVIDSRKRIAGQYSLTDREDADRLILELKILLKHY